MLSPVTLLVVAGAVVGVWGTSSSTDVCETELKLCLADSDCNACLTGPEPTDFCSSRYPWIWTSGSAGEGAAAPSYCETTGASNCCEHETEEISNQCLTNEASIAFWTCVMADAGCFINDMPCFGAVGWTAEPYAPITPSPFFAPTTPTPVAPETVDFANGAARMFGVPRRAVVLVLLGLATSLLFY